MEGRRVCNPSHDFLFGCGIARDSRNWRCPGVGKALATWEGGFPKNKGRSSKDNGSSSKEDYNKFQRVEEEMNDECKTAEQTA